MGGDEAKNNLIAGLKGRKICVFRKNLLILITDNEKITCCRIVASAIGFEPFIRIICNTRPGTTSISQHLSQSG